MDEMMHEVKARCDRCGAHWPTERMKFFMNLCVCEICWRVLFGVHWHDQTGALRDPHTRREVAAIKERLVAL